MRPVKTGDTVYCEGCGVELTVVKSCGCNDCNIICCGKPMKVKGEEKTGSSCCCCGR